MMPSADGNGNDNNNNSNNSKAAAASSDDGAAKGGGGRKGAQQQQKPGEQGLKCPRCDSSNTKFCYYNNYSLSQPRHFCKTCRRYWTKGGALRNVPIGGGCRKSNKHKSSKSRSSAKDSLSSNYPHHHPMMMMISPSASMDFHQLIGTSTSTSTTSPYNFPHGLMINSSIISPNFDAAPFPNPPNPCCQLDAAAAATAIRPPSSTTLMGGFSFPVNQSGGLMNFNTSLASSIESLSCINQDMHLKLQQQRLGVMLIGGDHHDQEIVVNNHKESSFVDDHHHQEIIINQSSKPVLQSISFQNLEVLKPVLNISTTTTTAAAADHDHDHDPDHDNDNDNSIMRPTTTTTSHDHQYWFFENSSSSPYNCTPNSTTVSSSTNNKGGGGGGGGDCMNTSNWSASGLHQYSWNDLNQYGGLP
ncbi:hypothetical protein Scep_020419 [Stephania cephalantha]|uniref:Dof zinc finger protein n=1 Tax=Stephania cephalantha TaxID=152367 RepID=A0AAP0NP90_9MAGN